MKIKRISPGKQVNNNLYLHHTAVASRSDVDTSLLRKAALVASVEAGTDFNVFKIDLTSSVISLLDYEDFSKAAFPELRQYWRVDLTLETFTYRHYRHSLNPPILHRKELLLPADHKEAPNYEQLTKRAELLGLFKESNRIGFKLFWEELVSSVGYQVIGHELLPIGNEINFSSSEIYEPNLYAKTISVERHRTALTRSSLSAPIQALARYGYLDGRFDLFDYGCGKGDDIRNLELNGVNASGWDPYYAPTASIRNAAIVNLGFVINVIEDFDERAETILKAHQLATSLIVISAMLINEQALRGNTYNDGVITQRKTFQKYYTQKELKDFISSTLDDEPIPVGPGIFFAFKDKDMEQMFLLGRQRNIYAARKINVARTSLPLIRERKDRYSVISPIIENLWAKTLLLGRWPEPDEVESLMEIIEAFGTLRKALRYIFRTKNVTTWVEAQQGHRDDLLVYIALSQFSRRAAYKHLEIGLQRDIRSHFGDYTNARSAARDLLFKASSIEALSQNCERSSESGIGWLEPYESLTLPTVWVNRLPPLLRVYVGCGLMLYGDAESADLIKIHIQSGKLTLMIFDDFIAKPLPRMLERIKINLRELDFNVFEYGDEYPPPYLYRKSRYINEEFQSYSEQLVFDEMLESLERDGIVDLQGYGPKVDIFNAALETNRWQIKDYKLCRSTQIPDLDEPCGRYFTYRHLIKAGETQASTGLSNLPSEPASYNALLDLTRYVLDPVIDYFGMIELTYGFCSRELAIKIPGKIAPKLDQHAAHELDKRNLPLCPRLGAAADFIIQDENMQEVADWIIKNTPFDRLYFYGAERPLHVSYGPEQNRQSIHMTTGKSGRLIPRIYKI